MFGKRPLSGKDALAQRVRQLSARDAPSGPAPAAARPQRTATFKNGAVILPDGARLAVVIKDLSEFGARVQYSARTLLPEEVTLVESMLKLRRRARVAWQTDGAAGLEFIA